MTTNASSQSAKIYIFPTRLRTQASNAAEQSTPPSAQQARPVVEATGGSGWYHEAAIREARERAR